MRTASRCVCVRVCTSLCVVVCGCVCVNACVCMCRCECTVMCVVVFVFVCLDTWSCPITRRSPSSCSTSMLLCLLLADTECSVRLPGIFLRALADHSHFQVPGNATVLRDIIGAVDGNHRNADLLMEHKQCVLVYPGGARETFKRVKDRKYQLFWKKHAGFAKVPSRPATDRRRACGVRPCANRRRAARAAGHSPRLHHRAHRERGNGGHARCRV